MFELAPRPSGPLPIAISECLLGSNVRYDGSGARSSFPHQELSGLFEYRGICPEVGIGLGVPRPAIALFEDKGAQVTDTIKIRALGVNDATLDVTAALTEYAQAQLPKLETQVGYVFMKNSPSCGLHRVKLYPKPNPQRGGQPPPARIARGVYADAITQALPNLPAEDSGRLFDPQLRENFVMRTFAYAHWLAFLAQFAGSAPTAQGLLAFHSRYKYLLMAHSVPHYKLTGRLLSNLRGDRALLASEYLGLLMQGLAKPASRGRHSNVLSHLQGYLKRELDGSDRQELAQLIEAYRVGEQPLMAPLALLKHHLRQLGDNYPLYQTYLEPHPPAAGLRRLL